MLLEARDRLGGRTWYRHLPGTDVMAEYGGTWFFLDTQTALGDEIRRAGVSLNEPMMPVSLAWLADGTLRSGESTARAVTDALAGAAVLDETVARIAREIATSPSGAIDIEACRDLDVPVTTWLRANDVTGDAAAFMLAFAATMGGGEPSRMSMLGLVLDAATHGYRFDQVLGDFGSSLAEGTSSLVDAIADQADADIRLSSPVVRVRSFGDSVSADIAGGGEVQAAAAVVALPLHVWVDVAFDPPLGEDKRRAAISGHAGASTKVLAIAEHVPQGAVGVGWPAALQAVIVGAEVTGGGRLVTGFSGTRAIRCRRSRRCRASDPRLFPEALVSAADGHDWVTDPYSKSTWFAERPGWYDGDPADRRARRSGRVRRVRHRHRGGRMDRGRGPHRSRCRGRRRGAAVVVMGAIQPEANGTTRTPSFHTCSMRAS